MDDVVRDSGTGDVIPLCLQRFVGLSRSAAGYMWTLDKKALLGQMVGRALKGSRRHFHSAISTA